jgi:hypothetical protein
VTPGRCKCGKRSFLDERCAGCDVAAGRLVVRLATARRRADRKYRAKAKARTIGSPKSSIAPLKIAGSD